MLENCQKIGSKLCGRHRSTLACLKIAVVQQANWFYLNSIVLVNELPRSGDDGFPLLVLFENVDGLLKCMQASKDAGIFPCSSLNVSEH